MGGVCSVGDIGPSGGPIIEVSGDTYVEAAPAGWHEGSQDDPEWSGIKIVEDMKTVVIANQTGWELPSMTQLGAFCYQVSGANSRSNLPCAGLSNSQLTPDARGAGLVPKMYWTSNILNRFNMYGLDLGWGYPNIWIGNATPDIHVRPVRTFSLAPSDESSSTSSTTMAPSTTEATTTTEVTTTTVVQNGIQGATVSNELFAPENVKYELTNDAVKFTWTNSTKGLPSEGIFVLMHWESLGGDNCEIVSGTATSASTRLFPFIRRGKMTFKLRAYTNATRPSKIADTEEIVIDFDAEKTITTSSTNPTTESTATPVIENPVTTQILNPEEPMIEVGPQEITEEVKPSDVVEAFSQIVPDIATVETIELSFDGIDWQNINLSGDATKVVVPSKAETAKVRITLKNGSVISQDKQILRTITTEEDSQIVNELAGNTAKNVDSNSSSNTVLWSALGIAVLAVLGISARKATRKKA
jgi:hypothetical protein